MEARLPEGRARARVSERKGKLENHGNIVRRILTPVLVAAGVVDAQRAEPSTRALHALRHFYASWCINRQADGGLELPTKTCSSGSGTVDRHDLGLYGHLFPRGDDGGEMAEAEKLLLA